MNRCPITYEMCEESYTKRGLALLSKKLQRLVPFPFTAQEQLELALQYASKISIQGVQPKLSVVLNVTKECFETVEKGGTFILKPPHHLYEQLPQNEDLSMRLAAVVGIEVPLHGLIYNMDGTLTYFIKRFDRVGRKGKFSVEDFSQLLGYSRETKYESSMEKLIAVIEMHCSFPLLEKIQFFRRVIFNFLIGNEDMHLKNFSLINNGSKVTLSPAYDLLNSTIVLKATEEIALPLRGKKSHLNRFDFFDYFGKERLKLTPTILEQEWDRFVKARSTWDTLLKQSFLTDEKRSLYTAVLQERWDRLSL